MDPRQASPILLQDAELTTTEINSVYVLDKSDGRHVGGASDPSSIRPEPSAGGNIQYHPDAVAGSSTSLEDSVMRSSPWQVPPDTVEQDPVISRTYDQFAGLDETTILQAVVFIEDAYKYRSISHKLDTSLLHLYRSYLSWPVEIFRYVVIFVLHVLVILEYPSSLTLTSDVRFRADRIVVPCWVTEGIELVCLLLLLGDAIVRSYLMGQYYFWRHKWIVASIIIITVSLIDWSVSVGLGCQEYVRFRRMLRPFFILQNSSIMKKTVNCLRRTLPEIASVLALLFLHIFVFTLFGMLLFPQIQSHPAKNRTTLLTTTTESQNTSSIVPSDEESLYFRTLLDSFVNLLVLITTANNPDVMMPAYQTNRLYVFFFIIFLIIGLYCFMNMLTAVIYNQFRGYFLSSMQSSFFRRRLGVRASFEVLRRRKLEFRHSSSLASVSVEVGAPVVKAVVNKAYLSKSVKRALLMEIDKNSERSYSATEFQDLFELLEHERDLKQKPEIRWFQHPVLRRIQKVFVHKYFSYFGSVIAVANVIVITAQLATRYDDSISANNSVLRLTNFTFIIYYFVEQVLKILSMGVRHYFWFKANIFDALITLALVIGEIFAAATYGVPYSPKHDVTTTSLWNAVRFINILIMVRLFRIIPLIKSTSVIASTLMDLVKNLKSFAGIIVVIYYSFAILGMELFHDVMKFQDIGNSTEPIVYECGTYQQLQYWANNFDDFAAAVVVLWDVMVVNNWMVFLNAFREATSDWSLLYFIAWWLLSVVIVLNLFTALILENFIMKWDKSLHGRRDRSASRNMEESSHLMSVHEMFRGLLQEPAENELLVELSAHQYLQLDR